MIAETAVSGTAYSFDMLFNYRVPFGMTVAIGFRVLVPFGKGDRRRVGIVMRITEGDESSLKSLSAVIDSSAVLNDEQISLAEFLHDRTFCTYFDAVKTMLPPAMSIRADENFQLEKNFSDTDLLSDKAKKLFGMVSSVEDESILTELLKNYIADNGRLEVDELLDIGALNSTNIFRQAVGDASVKMIRLSSEYINSPEDFKITPKQKKAVEFLSEYKTASVKETAYMCGFTESVIKRLVVNGVAEEYEMELLRSIENGSEEQIDIDSIVLSKEQQSVRDVVFEQLTKKMPAVFLLHGVTGSGKTSVFEKLISDTVKLGRSTLMLIPEISLTPQVLTRFRALFGERVAVIHSGLSLGQRLDEYKRIKRGDADIIIGTRSAVFAPAENIGLIIIDEEGERSYKSEGSPRYYAHDVAKQRCAYHGAVLLLASATPSIESYYLAKRGVYKLLEMKNRYNNTSLPEVTIVDMNEERMLGNFTEFSKKLIDEVNTNIRKGEQSILLLNRRGFHTIMSCVDCYQPIYCPNCSIPLTYHKKNNKLMCHYCGFAEDPVTTCPLCGSDRLKSMGFGTQRLEEELAKAFPQARILRMDADTTFSRYSYEKGFSAFRNGEYDIMVGTQMIGKGLDFPNVTLVGVLSIDKALYAGDFRSYERTFSLITQVVGRGGRGQSSGRAVLQTFMPEHYVMLLASAQDYKGFYNEEISIRRTLIFPPFCDLCMFCFTGVIDNDVKTASEAVIKLMDIRLAELQPNTPVRVLGPVRASYGKIGGKYRWRIIMKFKNTAQMREFISKILVEGAKLKEMKKITFYADINGDIN